MVANDYDFLQALYDNGAKGSFDAVGIHTDTACLTTDPREYYREPSGRIGRYSFTGYRERPLDDGGQRRRQADLADRDRLVDDGRDCNTGRARRHQARRASRPRSRRDFLARHSAASPTTPMSRRRCGSTLADVDSSSPN